MMGFSEMLRKNVCNSALCRHNGTSTGHTVSRDRFQKTARQARVGAEFHHSEGAKTRTQVNRYFSHASSAARKDGKHEHTSVMLRGETLLTLMIL